MGRKATICVLVTVAFLALLSSFIPVSVARSQGGPTSTAFTPSRITESVTVSPIPVASTISLMTSYSESTSDTGIITNTIPIDSTSVTSISTSSAPTYSSWTTVTVTSTATSVTTLGTTTSSGVLEQGDYSISFSPQYWLCTNVLVTFTGPLVESGLYGDILQFQYFQYNPSYPSVLYPIFTDPDLTVTSDTVSYWINSNEYAGVNFAYLPNIAVKVVDVTPKSNGFPPGQILFQLTNLNPEGSQYCQYDAPTPVSEFQTQWLMVMASVALSLLLIRVHKPLPSP